MPSISNDFWIFSKEGHPMINFNSREQLSEDLLGSFVRTIKDLGKLSGKELQSVTLGNYKYTCLSCCENNAFIVHRAQSSIKDKHIAKKCTAVKDLFEEMHQVNNIACWDGDISHFDDFKKKLDLYFKMSEL